MLHLHPSKLASKGTRVLLEQRRVEEVVRFVRLNAIETNPANDTSYTVQIGSLIRIFVAMENRLAGRMSVLSLMSGPQGRRIIRLILPPGSSQTAQSSMEPPVGNEGPPAVSLNVARCTKQDVRPVLSSSAQAQDGTPPEPHLLRHLLWLILRLLARMYGGEASRGNKIGQYWKDVGEPIASSPVAVARASGPMAVPTNARLGAGGHRGIVPLVSHTTRDINHFSKHFIVVDNLHSPSLEIMLTEHRPDDARQHEARQRHEDVLESDVYWVLLRVEESYTRKPPITHREMCLGGLHISGKPHRAWR
ncbi:hypothetical protein BU17DRAFT_83033 [Hysterangium stoloniferum]|nr:hypothetical protein BU17DRAFT_83033 [Hysterangium stoloniferum]